jgi:four helix bundle protein
MCSVIQSFRDLNVYQRGFDLAMRLYRLSATFPKSETYSLTDQVRRSSRSVCANLGEAWGKRRYPASFVSKLSDCEAEALETQVWIDFAMTCEYVSLEEGRAMQIEYDLLIKSLVGMQNHSDDWCFPKKVKS